MVVPSTPLLQNPSTFNSIARSKAKLGPPGPPPVPQFVGGFDGSQEKDQRESSSISTAPLGFCHNYNPPPTPGYTPSTFPPTPQVPHLQFQDASKVCGSKLSDFVNPDGTLKPGFSVTSTAPASNPQDQPHADFWAQQPKTEPKDRDIMDKFQYLSAEDVFEADGTVKPGYETILDYAVFIMPDGTACQMSDLLASEALKPSKSPSIKKKKKKGRATPKKYKISSELSNSSMQIPFQPFEFQGVTIYPDKMYHVPIAGLPDLVKIPGFNLYPLEGCPNRIFAIINNTEIEITAVIGDSDPSDPSYQATPHNSNYNVAALETQSEVRAPPLVNIVPYANSYPKYPTINQPHYPTINQTTQNNTAPQSSLVSKVQGVCAVMTSTSELGSSLAQKMEKVERAQNTSPAPPPPSVEDKVSGESGAASLVYTVQFPTSTDPHFIGHPVCSRSRPLRVGPYTFLYPINTKGEAEGPDGKPLPRDADGRVRYPTDTQGRPVGPQGKLLPTGRDGYPVAPNGKPMEPCGRLVYPGVTAPRFPVGPGGVHMWPVDIHGRSCDLKGQPLPTQEDGRPEWPVDMQGKPVSVDGKVMATAPDGYPVDPKGRYLAPGGSVVIKPKLPYPHQYQLGLPEFLKGTNVNEDTITVPFQALFGPQFALNPTYRSLFTVPEITVMVPATVMQRPSGQEPPISPTRNGYPNSWPQPNLKQPMPTYKNTTSPEPTSQTTVQNNAANPTKTRSPIQTLMGFKKSPALQNNSPTKNSVPQQKYSPAKNGIPQQQYSPTKNGIPQQQNSPTTKPVSSPTKNPIDSKTSPTKTSPSGKVCSACEQEKLLKQQTPKQLQPSQSIVSSASPQINPPPVNSYPGTYQPPTNSYVPSNNSQPQGSPNNYPRSNLATSVSYVSQAPVVPGIPQTFTKPTPVNNPKPTSPAMTKPGSVSYVSAQTGPSSNPTTTGSPSSWVVVSNPSNVIPITITEPAVEDTQSVRSNTQSVKSNKSSGSKGPYYAVYLNNSWVQIAKKHARASKSRPDHLVVKYTDTTYLVPQSQVKPLQVPGAARREIVTVVVPQPAGRASIERTFSVERLSQPPQEKGDVFVIQLHSVKPPTDEEIAKAKDEILSVHPLANIISDEQFRANEKIAKLKPIIVRIQNKKNPHYFRFVEDFTDDNLTEASCSVKKADLRVEHVIVPHYSDVSIPM